MHPCALQMTSGVYCLYRCPECGSIFAIRGPAHETTGKNPKGKIACNWCGCTLPRGHFITEYDV